MAIAMASTASLAATATVCHVHNRLNAERRPHQLVGLTVRGMAASGILTCDPPDFLLLVRIGSLNELKASLMPNWGKVAAVKAWLLVCHPEVVIDAERHYGPLVFYCPLVDKSSILILTRG